MPQELRALAVGDRVMEDVFQAIRAMIEQQVREADSRKRSAIAKAAWARRKANLGRASQAFQD